MISKKLTIGTLLAGIFAIVYGGQALAAITGSKHDFSGDAWNGTGEICIVCHTPHNAVTGSGNAPLWSHTETTSTFTMYSSVAGTLDGTIDAAPSGSSKLCLSCHDGTVALDNFVGNSVNPGTTIGGGALLDTDLSNDHPISIDYDAAADGGLFASTVPAVAALLFGNKVECASCHDVHDEANIAKLLTVANTGSALCLTCHDK